MGAGIRWARVIFSLATLAVLLTVPSPASGGFPGVNGKIAFTSDRDGNSEIYSMNADGTGQTNLTHNPALDYGPAWSPDGSRIAFTSDRDASNGYDVFVMNADGSGVVNLSHNPGLDWAPAWSPDGSKIAFTSYRAGGGEIFVMNADGSGVVRLTDNAAYDRHPKWSPDGTRIAFESQPSAGDWEIKVMNADGSGVTQVTNNSSGDFEPDWSPDSTRIAWRTTQFGDAGEIAVMNAEWVRGRERHQRPARLRPAAGVGTRWDEDRLRQLPDGQRDHGDERRRHRQIGHHLEQRERLRPRLAAGGPNPPADHGHSHRHQGRQRQGHGKKPPPRDPLRDRLLTELHERNGCDPESDPRRRVDVHGLERRLHEHWEVHGDHERVEGGHGHIFLVLTS